MSEGKSDLRFGFVAAPVERPGTGDAELYQEVVADCRLGQALGYESVWMIEHHFTDYFPTPRPLVFIGHIAALCPGLGLGTCVTVTPWYNPLRLAEELAMLSILSPGPLHIGMGRGTAPVEYEAFDIDMEEAHARFREAWEIIGQALTGEKFTYEGEFLRVPRAVNIRPRPRRDKIHFYGAIGSPQSGAIMAELGLPPLSIGNFPLHIQDRIMTAWRDGVAARGIDVPGAKPIVLCCFVADSDDQARALARHYMPTFYRLQVEHYEVDRNAWADIKGYEQFSKMFANLKKLSDPEQLDPWLDLQLVGSPATVSERIEQYAALGFDKFVIHAATVGIPRAVRHDAMTRFAAEVAPRFSTAFESQAVA